MTAVTLLPVPAPVWGGWEVLWLPGVAGVIQLLVPGLLSGNHIVDAMQ